MSELLEQLGQDFQNEDARYAYADSVVNAFVAAQIKALREARDLNQEKLAELVGTKQSGISRLERVDYSAWKIETLRKLARAFGVRLRISFEEFGTLLDDLTEFQGRRLLPRRFEDDPVFKEGRRGTRRRLRTRSSNKQRHRFGIKRRPQTQDIPKKSPGREMMISAIVGLPRRVEPGGVGLGNNSTDPLQIMVGGNRAAHP